MQLARKPASKEIREAFQGPEDNMYVWVVPPRNGRVKKLRLTVRSVCLIVFCCFVFLAGFSFIAGDYARLQLLRAENYFFLSSLTHERDSLKSSNQELKNKLEKMRSERVQVSAYEQKVQQRLDELKSVMAGVQAMGVEPLPPQHEALARPNAGAVKDQPKAGIGGAEEDCAVGDLRCAGLVLDDDEEAEAQPQTFMQRLTDRITAPFRYLAEKSREFFARRDQQNASVVNKQLLAQLDQSIAVLKVLPFGMPGTTSPITSGFGYRKSPFTGNRTLHQGIDFGLPAGSKVATTGDGIVKSVRFTPTYGLVIDIEHTPQVVTRYAHLRQSLVREGEKVSRGGTIGIVGSTGNSTGPHLHYEIRVDDQPRNPEDMIALGEQLAALY